MIERTHRLRSAHLGNERDIWVREPARLTADHGLVVFLDAELYRDRVGAPSIVEGLEAAAEIRPALCVYVSCASVEARWVESPCHPPCAEFIADELMPWLESMYPHVGSCAERVLVGLSYTGLAASYVALRTGGMFTAVVSQSGSYWSNDTWLARQYAGLTHPLPVRFHLEVGRRETQENVRHKEDVLQIRSQIDGARLFRDALVATGHEVNYQEFDGGHDFACWQQTLPAALRWALPPAGRAMP